MDSSTVFGLRKEAKVLHGEAKLSKLNESLILAKQLYQTEPFDEWIQKALAYTLIDLCKFYIDKNQIESAVTFYNNLIQINFTEFDEIIENQKKYLRPKLDPHFSYIKRADELSKAGNHIEALNIFKDFINKNQLSELHHESYGWVIYRYLAKSGDELTSIQVRTYLRDYMLLKNERPSMLHSMILNFGLNYSKNHSDFNLYQFFKLWNPSNLRDEDKGKQYYQEKEIPSLVSRVCRVLIEKDYEIDVAFLIEKIKLDSWRGESFSTQKVLDLLREPFFWKIMNAKKENNFNTVWKLFSNYLSVFSSYGQSHWNSEILNIAERLMVEKDEPKFLAFFNKWNPGNLLEADWEEQKVGENAYPPLAKKCLKKAFTIIKNQEKVNLNWLISVYEKAKIKFPKDNWVLREKGLLHIWNGEIEKGKVIFKKLLLELGDKFYIWNEFSNCFNDNLKLKIAMLCKAIQLERNEDFLGDVRLELSKALIENSQLENAVVELQQYKTHRIEKGWRLSDTYEDLMVRTKDVSISSLNSNIILYQEFIPFAEEYVYQDISWTEVVLTGLWRNEKNVEKCNFSNGEDVNFSISKKRFKELRNVQIGKVFNFKLLETLKEGEVTRRRLRRLSIRQTQRKSNFNYSPLMIKASNKSNWSILKDEYAIIDYINLDKNVIHGITTKNETIFFKDDIRNYQQGDFVFGKRLRTERNEKVIIELKNIFKSSWEDSISFFPVYKVVIDHVNFNKKLFHFVADKNTDGIIRFHETKLKLKAGSIIEIRMVRKKNNKTGKMVNRILEINESDELTHDLMGDVSGKLTLNYKDGISSIPDFGFVKDIYVSKSILEKNNIIFDCMVKAKAIFSNGKWRIFELKEV